MKLKSFLTLLLSAGILVLGALLPRFVGERQDAVNDNQVLFAPINDVQLKFTQEEITLSQTVAMLGGYREAVEIPYGLTSLGQDKAEAAAIAAAKRYCQAGVMFQDTVNQGEILYCQPILIYGNFSYDTAIEQRYDGSSINNRQSNIYWQVTYGSIDGAYTLYTVIDDRTGMVCSIEYTDGKHKYKQADMEFVLSSFCDLYLTDLGEEFYWCNVSDIAANAKAPLDNSYLASDISWNDTVYGECRITFFVNECGFYTNIQRPS